MPEIMIDLQNGCSLELQYLFTFVSRNNIHPWTLPFLLPLAHILLTGKALFSFDPAEGNWLEGICIFVIS